MLSFIAVTKENGLRLATRMLVLGACLFLTAAMLGVFLPSGARAQDITSGLAGHWTFDQGSGTTANDAAGTNNGTLTGGPAWVAGQSGKALDFDGVDDFVSYPANIEFDNGDFTIAGWFKRNGTESGPESGNFAIFAQRTEATGNGNPVVALFGRSGGTGFPAVQIRDNAGAAVTLAGVSAVDDGVWNHVAAVKTGIDIKLYVNGALNSTASHSLSGDFDAGATLRLIGKNRYGTVDQSFSNGLIDDVRVYKRALSDADMASLYNNTAGLYPGCKNPDADEGVIRFEPASKVIVMCDGRDWIQVGESSTGGSPDIGMLVTNGLVGYWKLDQTGGTSAPGTPGSAGTLTNMNAGAAWIGGKFGKALAFDGIDDIVVIPHFEAINFDTNDNFTISAWVEIPSAPQPNTVVGQNSILEKWNGGASYPFVLRYSQAGKTVHFARYNGSASSGVHSPVLEPDRLHHLVFIKDGADISLYVNGSHAAEAPDLTTGSTKNNHPLWLGARNNLYNFKGKIDDLRIYNRALTVEEIHQLFYAMGPGCTDPNGDAGGLVYNSSFSVLQYCNGVEWVALGGQGGGTYVPTGSGDPHDTIPASFNFVDVTTMALNAVTTSSAITPTGYAAPAAVSVSGDGSPEISINGGAWGTTGTIAPGQTIAVRLTSANSVGAERTATVTIGGVSDVWHVTTQADTTPNAFTFVDQTGVALSSLITSNSIVIGGINAATPVSVTGAGSPKIRINGGAWVTSGTITNGQTLEVQLTSGSGFSETRTATIDVGGVEDEWSVTTLGADTTPNAFIFADVTGANLSTLTTASTITISGINTSTPVSVSGTGATISINGGAWVTSGTITNGQTLAVRLTSSASFSTAMSATVNVGGVTDAWSVTTRAGNSCSAASRTWLTNCTATVSSAAHGANGTGTIANPGGCGTTWYGSGTFACNDGALSYSTGTCTQQTACDTAPNAFTFADVTGANPSTLTTASAITISGINTSTPVSVSGTGATISINGGAWVTSGNITNGQTLAVRLTSSASFSTAMSATVNVGGVTDSWSVTTRAASNCTVGSGTTWTVSSSTCTVPSTLSISHGGSSTATDSTAPTTGSKTFTCSDGTVGVSGTPTCTTAAGCGGTLIGGYCWYLGLNNQDCNTVCASRGGYNAATLTYAGSSGTKANCTVVIDTLLGAYSYGWAATDSNTSHGVGCNITDSDMGYGGTIPIPSRVVSPATTATAKWGPYRRACACNN